MPLTANYLEDKEILNLVMTLINVPKPGFLFGPFEKKKTKKLKPQQNNSKLKL